MTDWSMLKRIVFGLVLIAAAGLGAFWWLTIPSHVAAASLPAYQPNAANGKTFAADAAHSAAWNRGAYLVNGLGHCAECHSPRNFLGGIVTAQRFAGGPNPEGEGWIPNITQKALADWSAGDFTDFLETGDL